jgi:hypothetical protein
MRCRILILLAPLRLWLVGALDEQAIPKTYDSRVGCALADADAAAGGDGVVDSTSAGADADVDVDVGADVAADVLLVLVSPRDCAACGLVIKLMLE